MKSHLNLLPWQIRYRLVRRARLMQWSVVLGATLAVLAGIGGLRHHELRRAREIVAAQQQEVQPLEEMQLQSSEMQERLEQLSGLELLLAEVERSQYTLGLVGVVSRSAARTNQRIQVLEFNFQRRNETRVKPGPDGKPVNEPTEAVYLTLEGIAIDDLAVAQFVAELQDSGAFENVRLTSSDFEQIAIGNGRKYKVDCRL